MSPKSSTKGITSWDEVPASSDPDTQASQSPELGYAFSPVKHTPSPGLSRNDVYPNNEIARPQCSAPSFPTHLLHHNQHCQSLNSIQERPVVLTNQVIDDFSFDCPREETDPFEFANVPDVAEAVFTEYTPRSIGNKLYQPRNRPCIASPQVICYCPRCAATNDLTLENINHIPNTPWNSNQSYRFDTVGPGGPSLPSSTTILTDYRQTTPQYGQNEWDAQFVPSSYVSLPMSFNKSIGSLHRSNWVPGSSQSAVGTGSQSHLRSMDDIMYNSYQEENIPNSLKSGHNLQKRNRSRRKLASRNQPSIVVSMIDDSEALDDVTFLKAQKYLSMEPNDGNTLPKAKKEPLSNLLGISQSKLESWIKARHEFMPIFNEMASTGYGYKLSADQVARWFVEEQSQNSNTGRLNDSAYHSKVEVPEDSPAPTKKRKRITKLDEMPKNYQCTFIESDGSYCEQESNSYSDWKRHEETHWPHEIWVCLCTEQDGAVICHCCTGNIDLTGQPLITSHHSCISKSLRKGHNFPRRDKLIKHVKEVHGYEANIDLWHAPVASEWKKQCGFCGSEFSDWDERCKHVGLHFRHAVDPKRMRPDWKDPWPENTTLLSKRPGNDDDDDDNDDDEDYDDHDDSDDEDDTSDVPPKRKRNASLRIADAALKDTPDGKRNPGDGSSNDRNGKTNPSDSHSITLNSCKQKYSQITDGHFQQTQDYPRKEGDNGDIFTWTKDLGHGAFGIVDEVKHCPTKTHFARKTVRVTHGFPALLQAHQEVAALRNLGHPHIVNIVASYTWDSNFSILMYPVAECTLSELMLDENATPLTQVSQLSVWIRCLTHAVSYMHEKLWLHLDIKPSNILISGNHVMLSDFGGAMNVHELRSRDTMDRRCTITPMYCAPEISPQSKVLSLSRACDIWSLGCVYLEMTTVMFREKLQKFDEFRSFGSGDGTYHKNLVKCSTWIDHLYDINENLGLPPPKGLETIKGMLRRNWKMRPSARDISKSDLLQNSLGKGYFIEERYLLVSYMQDFSDVSDIIKAWLRTCRLAHKICSNLFRKEFSPSRLLNVGIGSNFIRLQSSFIDSSDPYVALSYCWDREETLITTSKTLDKMSKGIEISSLSKTFLNAVRITQALGFNYLWIDALCIIQDSKADRTAEVSQMAKIYSHSSLTISILSDYSTPVDALKQKPRNQNFNIKHQNLVCSSCPGNCSKAFEPLVSKTSTTMIFNSSWFNRGWTLQEAILSPRVLYCSSAEIAWECDHDCRRLDNLSLMRKTIRSLVLSNGSSICASSPPKSAAKVEFSQSPPPFPPLHSFNFRKIWHNVIREYSRRQLSYPEDKLPALAGVVSVLAEASNKTYVAGLWKEDVIHHPTELLWCRDFASIPLPEPEYRAPTWSWASIEGAAVWPKHIFADVNDSLDADVVKVLNCCAMPISQINPYGGVTDGSLQVWGSLIEVTVVRPKYEQLLFIDSKVPFAFVQWDVLHTVENILACPVEKDNDNGLLEFVCLRIAPSAGLVLVPKKEKGIMTLNVTDTFERVGIYWDQGESFLLPSGERGSEDWLCRTITIV